MFDRDAVDIEITNSQSMSMVIVKCYLIILDFLRVYRNLGNPSLLRAVYSLVSRK